MQIAIDENKYIISWVDGGTIEPAAGLTIVDVTSVPGNFITEWTHYQYINGQFIFTEGFISEADKEALRARRQKECFDIISHGSFIIKLLENVADIPSFTQRLNEFQQWYQGWLDVTETNIIPQYPTWIQQLINYKSID